MALAQSKSVADQLKYSYPFLEIKFMIIKTKGDHLSEISSIPSGDKGLFVKELEIALLKKEADLAVHSAKDLPAILPDDLELLAFPKREDPRDVLLTSENLGWEEIPQGAIIGTSSLRRQSQILFARPDLSIQPLRGNVDTRIRKLYNGDYWGIILAQAGLNRLGISQGKPLNYKFFLPAPAQGAIALEMRKDNSELNKLVKTINHSETQSCILAERTFLKEMEGGCQTPLGCLAVIDGNLLRIEGFIALPNGSKLVRVKVEGDGEFPEQAGEMLAKKLLTEGKEIINALASSAGMD